VPPRLNQDLRGAGLQAGQEVAHIPFPGGLSRALAVRVLAPADGVIDNGDVPTPACQRAADACGIVLAALFSLPLASGLPVRRHAAVEHVPMRLGSDEVPDATTESVSQILSVRRGDHGTLGVAPEIPRGEDLTHIHGLPASGRHEDHQPPALTPLNRLKMAN
jgi:hypothetical protein